jgi:hypothetical protein
VTRIASYVAAIAMFHTVAVLLPSLDHLSRVALQLTY